MSKTTPEPETQQPKAESGALKPPAEGQDDSKARAQSAIKEEDDDVDKSRWPSSERNGSEMPPGEAGPSSRKEEGDEEKSAAAAAKERQLLRAETIR